MKTNIDLSPTREGYINMLKLLIESSTNEKDKAWALNELVKLANGASYMQKPTATELWNQRWRQKDKDMSIK